MAHNKDPLANCAPFARELFNNQNGNKFVSFDEYEKAYLQVVLYLSAKILCANSAGV